jgi:hypothetical protein
MTKKHIGYVKLFTQDELNNTFEKYEVKQKALIEVVIKKRVRKGEKKKEIVRVK